MNKQALFMTVPEMTMDEYAKHIGVTYKTVESWVNRGYLPSRKLGKYRMINVAAVFQERLEDIEQQ